MSDNKNFIKAWQVDRPYLTSGHLKIIACGAMFLSHLAQCGAVSDRQMNSQVMDNMDIEKERGITTDLTCVVTIHFWLSQATLALMPS